MRGAIAIALAAGLLLGGILVLPASGAQDRPARARAIALIAGGDVGPHAGVLASGAERRERQKGSVDQRGLKLERGSSLARTEIADGDATAVAVAVAHSVTLLDGLVTAETVRRRAVDRGERDEVSGGVTGLVISGQPIGDVEKPDQAFPLPDGAGTVTVNHETAGLLVTLDKDTAGFAAGSEIRVAIAKATARDAVVAEPTPTPDAKSEAGKTAGKKAGRQRLERKAAPAVRRRLTADGFAFPVYGPADVADDFGAARQIGAHQGNDVFADFGAPVVAVADGVISKVGTLEISGNRLWLTTEGGDAFFYAHLAAFSPAAVDGARVKAGTVLGFVGNTGDAEPTPPHVHFEVHPGGEEQDAVDPHEILLAWQGRRDVAPGAWLQRSGTDTTERPGALVAVRDFIAE